MNVLVTGGTGFVGRAVLRELHRAGHGIFVLSRERNPPAQDRIEDEFSGRLRSGNILDPQSLVEACAGVDAIIHLVGIISEAREQTYERVHTDGTRNILEAAKRSGVKRFVHMSALGTRPNAVARYHKSKWTAEELVRNSGLQWTIFRPSIIYGPGDGFVNLFAKMSRWSPIVPLIGGGRTRFAPVPVGAVASAFVQSLSNQDAIAKTFDLCRPETFTLRQIVELILHVTRRRRLKLSMPFPVARMQGRLLESLFALIGKAPPLNCDQVLMLQEDNVGDATTAASLFRLEMPSFSDGIATYLKPRPHHT